MTPQSRKIEQVESVLVRQRIDKWLCVARVVKTRSRAADLVEEGFVRVNGVRSVSAARMIGAGDVLTVALERHVRVIRVKQTAERRGPFSEARHLFEDLAPDHSKVLAPLDDPELLVRRGGDGDS